MTAVAHRPHPVTSVIVGMRQRLGSVAEVPLWSMDVAETAAALDGVAAAEAQLAELRARLLLRAEETDAAGGSGATSTANWYAARTRTTRPAAHRAVRLARGLEQRRATRAAMASGTVHSDQALVILTALDELPTDLDTRVVDDAERRLVEHAATFDAKALKVLGRRVLEVVDPNAGDAHEAKVLEREERAAARATSLVMWGDGHGKVHGRFTLDAVTGSMLRKALHAIAAPRHQAASGPLPERRPAPERLGRAFAEYVQRYPADSLPRAGGLAATVVVTMTLDSLLGGLKAAELDTGGVISAGQARRLACEAGIIPAVLGGKSEVLDLGRSRRFHSPAQRIVATIEQKGCAAEGCDYPPAMTHLHHPIPWSMGGETNRDAIMLCPRHHTRAHDPAYRMTRQPNDTCAFHRRC